MGQSVDALISVKLSVVIKGGLMKPPFEIPNGVKSSAVNWVVRTCQSTWDCRKTRAVVGSIQSMSGRSKPAGTIQSLSGPAAVDQLLDCVLTSAESQIRVGFYDVLDMSERVSFSVSLASGKGSDDHNWARQQPHEQSPVPINFSQNSI